MQINPAKGTNNTTNKNFSSVIKEVCRYPTWWIFSLFDVLSKITFHCWNAAQHVVQLFTPTRWKERNKNWEIECCLTYIMPSENKIIRFQRTNRKSHNEKKIGTYNISTYVYVWVTCTTKTYCSSFRPTMRFSFELPTLRSHRWLQALSNFPPICILYLYQSYRLRIDVWRIRISVWNWKKSESYWSGIVKSIRWSTLIYVDMLTRWGHRGFPSSVVYMNLISVRILYFYMFDDLYYSIVKINVEIFQLCGVIGAQIRVFSFSVSKNHILLLFQQTDDRNAKKIADLWNKNIKLCFL